MTVQQATPSIDLVRAASGEVTLMIDDVQAMQGWEQALMWRAADLLCARGTDFLEAGLGLGLSATRIAGRPGVRRHVVVEKYAKVIDLFRQEHPRPPAALRIEHADFFDYLDGLAADSFDGVFFDPELPRSFFSDRDLVDGFMPKLVRALRPGASFVPMFSLDGTIPDAATCTALPGVMLDRYLRFFDRVVVERHPYTAYADTRYTPATTGDAFILCFYRADG
jgi:predicted methyltransferase